MSVEKIDITKEYCPMTFVKAKLALAKLPSGDTLEVKLSGGEPLENIPRSASEEGHDIISIEEDGDFYKVLIRKK